MKKACQSIVFCFVIVIFLSITLLNAQSSSSSTVEMYVSKQSGTSSPPLTGSYSKTTDKYAHGSVSLTTQGPITYSVNPSDLSIGTNSSKNWNGSVSADVGASPEPGNSANATLYASYDIYYSEYCGSSDCGGNSYSCPGCAAHTEQGYHHIVNATGTESASFIIYSIKATIGDISCTDSVVKLHADVFPYGGTLSWTTPFGNQTGNDVQVNVGSMPNSFDVSVTYSIGGVSYTDTKQVQKAKLIGFTLPCCIDTTKNVADIAVLTFDGPCHPQVTFNPSTLSPGGATGKETKTVTATADGVSIDATTDITNSNIALSFTPINYNFEGWKDRFVNCLVSGLNGGVSPCAPSGSWIPTGSLGFESSNMCCPASTPCSQISNKFSGQANWSWGMTCHFPVFGVPYCASVDLVASASVDGAISLSSKTTCTTPKVCAGLDITVRAGGGIGATLLAGFISADLQLQISAGFSGQACVYPLPLSASGNFNVGKVKVAGTVSQVWGMISRSVDYVVWDGYTSPTLSYP